MTPEQKSAVSILEELGLKVDKTKEGLNVDSLKNKWNNKGTLEKYAMGAKDRLLKIRDAVRGKLNEDLEFTLSILYIQEFSEDNFKKILNTITGKSKQFIIKPLTTNSVQDFLTVAMEDKFLQTLVERTEYKA